MKRSLFRRAGEELPVGAYEKRERPFRRAGANAESRAAEVPRGGDCGMKRSLFRRAAEVLRGGDRGMKRSLFRRTGEESRGGDDGRKRNSFRRTGETYNRKKQLICLLMLAALLLCGCEKPVSEPPALLPAAGVASDICAVRRGETSVPKAVDAWVSAHAEELSFPVNGTVGEVPVRAGDRVKAGDRLIVLDLDDVRAEYEHLKDEIDATRRVNELDFQIAEADLAILRAELSQLQRGGAEERTLALKELDIREAEMNLSHDRETRALSLSRSEKTLAELAETLSNDAIVAPFDGIIAREISVAVGSRVSAYDPVVCVADDSRLRITCDYVSAAMLRAATGGVYARIGGGRYEVEAIPIDNAEYVSRVLAGKKVYSEFEIVGPEGWRDEVRAGDYASLIFVNSYQADALLIPANAVLTDAVGKYVYVVGKNGERERRDVKLRVPIGALDAQVLEGLEEGERIYVTDK